MVIPVNALVWAGGRNTTLQVSFNLIHGPKMSNNELASPSSHGLTVSYMSKLKKFCDYVFVASRYTLTVIIPAIISTVVSYFMGFVPVSSWDFKHYFAYSMVSLLISFQNNL